MSRRTSIAIGALLAVPTALTAQEATVTLDRAIELALGVQPAIVQARGELRNAGATKLQNTGRFLPSLSMNGRSSRSSADRFNQATGEIVSGPSSTNYSGSFNLNLTLFDGFGRFNERKAANADIDAADG